ncbi:MAG: ribosomal protein L7/L12 [Archangium sp.]
MLLALIGVGVLVAGIAVTVLFMRRREAEVVTLKPPTPVTTTDSSPEGLMRAGQKIAAIKRFRELHGVGLKEAKDAVEAMERGQHFELPAKTLLREVADSDIEATIRRGALIDAIKLYREKNPGVGLKEAKDAVEAWRDRLRAS